jgi:protein CMS1
MPYTEPPKSELQASKAKSKKRPLDDEGGSSRKRKKKSRFDQDDLLFDMEAGVNKAIALMDSQLMADHLAQKTSRFGSDLSSVELSDLYISRTLSSHPPRIPTGTFTDNP